MANYEGVITLASVSDGSGGEGSTLYTWVAYADDASGTNISNTALATSKYIGFAYNQRTAPTTTPLSPSQYKWAEYVGKDGEDGADGIGIQSTTIEYAESMSGEEPPSTGWSTESPQVVPGKYLWTRVTIVYNKTLQPSVSYSVSYSGTDGENGEDGEDGRGISNTSIQYATSTSGTNVPTTGWSNTVPAIPEGQYLWTRTTISYTSGDPTVSYSVSYNGKDGEDGDTIRYTLYSNRNKIDRLFNIDAPYFPNGTIEFWLEKIENDTATILNPTLGYETKLEYIGYTDSTGTKNISLWDLFSNLTGKLNEESAQTQSLLSILRKYDDNNDAQKIIFNFSELFNIIDITGNANDIAIFNNIKNTLLTDNRFFILKAFSPDLESYNQVASNTFSVETNTDNKIAQFAVTAGNIQAAVNNAKMIFTNDGLSIIDGSFSIYDGNNNNLLNYDKDLHKLRMTGEIHADSGSFNGDIVAENFIGNSGTIGGWAITDTGLATYKEVDDSGKPIIDNPDIKLDSNGKIFAQNIELGTGAEIKDYIKLGDAFIRNPSTNNSVFIEAGDIKVLQNGAISVGGITINGEDSSISGENFSITPKAASFSNVNVSGKISSAVFSNESTQAVGGSMIFRPSYKVVSYSGNKIILDSSFKGGIDNNIYIIDTNGGVVGGTTYVITNIDNTEITIDGSIPENIEILNSIIDIGKDSDIIIGINSGNTLNGILRPRGLTISTIDSTLPRVFIGDFETSGITFGGGLLSGYGLYSENAYLIGTLTTELKSDNTTTYAGINTKDGVIATKFGNEDNTKIVFWAGSAGAGVEDIRNSLFQVTEQGSIYASRGVFEGALISKSEIHGAKIYTAEIYGEALDDSGSSTSGSLTFYDATKGITFKKSRDEESNSNIFSIGENGFYTDEGNKQNYFIEILNNAVNFSGSYITDSNSHLRIKDAYIRHEIQTNQSSNLQFGLDFSAGGLKIGNYDNGNNNAQLNITSTETDINTDLVKFQKDISYSGTLEYKKVSNGYDLYIQGVEENGGN